MNVSDSIYLGYDIMYDGAGRITRDVSRGIAHVSYNVTGTPFVVGTMTGDCAVYGYTSDGAKLSETIYNGSVTTRRDYVGPCEYVDGRLERMNVPQGYIDSLGTLHAYIRDIQGNIAGVYEAKKGKKRLEQLNEYYAYGGLTADSKGQDRNRYKHTGKELVSDLGINSYDFTARWQYPMAGAFTSPDALAHKMPWLSPYIFCGGDPINFIDPTGMKIECIDSDTHTRYEWIEKDGAWGFYNSSGELYSGNNEFVNALSNALTNIMKSVTGAELVVRLVNNDNSVRIAKDNYSNTNRGNNRIKWDYTGSNEHVPTTNGMDSNPMLSLAHELAHADYNLSGKDQALWEDAKQGLKQKAVSISELYTTYRENQLRNDFGLPLRTHYMTDGTGREGIGPELINTTNRTSNYVDINGNIYPGRIPKGIMPYTFVRPKHPIKL